MEEADYYDEFGNYIGPETENAIIDQEYNFTGENSRNGDEMTDTTGHTDKYLATLSQPTSSTVVLHEDKKFFPSAMEVYGESVQVLVEEEDAQPLTEPIIAPIKEVVIDNVTSEKTLTKYSTQYQKINF
jgi:116 kDa U5 small nuclear ribonucleoprotein component